MGNGLEFSRGSPGMVGLTQEHMANSEAKFGKTRAAIEIPL
jgi:hypothetical protein